MKRRSTLVIPYKFAESVCEKGLQKPFAVWLKLKTLYLNHTIIYNLSYTTLSKETNICVPTLKKYVKQIKDLGWAVERDGHLTLLSFKKVTGKGTLRNGTPIQVRKWMTFKQVVDRVSALVIINDYKKQEFRIGLDSGRIKARASAQRKLLKKYGYRAGKEHNRIMTSCERVAKQTGQSPSAAWRMMKRLTKEKVVKLRPVIERLGELKCPVENMSFHEDVHRTANGYVFTVGSYAYINRGTSIKLLS